jgi:signal transduction histidine kinase
VSRFATLLWSVAFLFAQDCGCIQPAHGQQRQLRMLVLYPDSNAIPAAAQVGEGIHKRLIERFPRPAIQMFNEFLEFSRFPDEAHRARVLRNLGEKYADRRPDVLVAVGSDALRTAIEIRSLLATTAPIVFCCASPATLATVERPADVTGIVTDFDVSKTVALAQRLQPNTRPLVVIAGAAPFDLKWAEIARAHMDADHRFDARYLVGLPRKALLDEVRKLPRDTIVLLLTNFKDGEGRDYVPGDIEEIASASSAPVYGPYYTYIGQGVVGGHTDTFEAIGAQTGDLINRILGGEDPKTIAPRMSTTQAFRVDARQLARWGLSADNLPDDTVVMYRVASVWEQHRSLVLGAIGAFLLQSAFLVFVLIQMRRRRLTERLLRRSEERLETIQDEERTRIAQDLHDSTAQHLTAASLSLARLREDVTLEPNARNAIEDAKGSLREAASELRDYAYLLHPPVLRRDGLDSTLQRYVEEFGQRAGLTIKLRSNGEGNDHSPVIQRSILRIVQGALANVHRHASASRVSIKLKRAGKRLLLIIVDDGRGIEAAHRDGKQLRAGIGIQAMASRVEQLGGRLSVRSGARGTIVRAVIPISGRAFLT